jgi:hypothetical protein
MRGMGWNLIFLVFVTWGQLMCCFRSSTALVIISSIRLLAKPSHPLGANSQHLETQERQVSSLACKQAELWSPGVKTLLPVMTGSNFQLIGSRTSHPDACTVMEHTHPSYAHINAQMSLAQWVKFEPKFYAQILQQQCVVSSIWAEPINVKKHEKSLQEIRRWRSQVEIPQTM